jgi:hypothetical protein
VHSLPYTDSSRILSSKNGCLRYHFTLLYVALRVALLTVLERLLIPDYGSLGKRAGSSSGHTQLRIPNSFKNSTPNNWEQSVRPLPFLSLITSFTRDQNRRKREGQGALATGRCGDGIPPQTMRAISSKLSLGLRGNNFTVSP